MIDGLLVWAVMSDNIKGVDLEQVTVSSGQNTVNFYDQQRSKPLEDRVMDLERLIYGEPRWSEPGMIKRQQRQLWVSQANMIINLVTALLLLLFMIWR